MNKIQQTLSEIQNSGNPMTSAEIAALRVRRPKYAGLVETLEGRSLAEVEELVDARRVQAEMRDGRYWDARRNGRTQTWKTRPGEFRIPVKAGLRSCGAITQANLADFAVKP